MAQPSSSAETEASKGKGERFDIKQILAYATSAIAIVTSVVSCQVKQAELKAMEADVKLKNDAAEAAKREQADEAKERSEKARKEYLANLASADRLSQARILRFIAKVESDERLRQWAESELEQLGKTVDKETQQAAQSVEALAAEATTASGAKAEEAQIKLAARSVDLARLKLAQSTIAQLGAATVPVPDRKATKAECFAFCSPPARQCEGACNGDRACLKSRCFPQEANCRAECLKGPPPT